MKTQFLSLCSTCCAVFCGGIRRGLSMFPVRAAISPVLHGDVIQEYLILLINTNFFKPICEFPLPVEHHTTL